MPLRIEGHLFAQSVCESSCSAEHHAAHASNLKGHPTCCSVLPDGMLMSVVELAAADLMLQPTYRLEGTQMLSICLGQKTDVVGKR